MKNVHVLPTDKSSRLHLIENALTITSEYKNSVCDSEVNIYITSSDEEIKDGEYGICLNLVREGFKSHQAVFKMDSEQRQAMEDLGGQKKAKVLKVILTTDQDLIADGVQAIDDEFLEWFIKNPSCEEVEVNDWLDANGNIAFGGDKRYQICNHLYDKIIIPKEEPKQEWTPTQGEQVWIKVFSNWSSGTYIGYDTTKHIHLVRENEEGGGNLLSSSKILPYKSMPNEPKQETLEEAAARHFNKEDLVEGVNIQYVLQCAFIQGANWQAKRMYSEEDMFEFSQWVSHEDWVYLPSKGYWVNEEQEELEQKLNSKEVLNMWFEQFKKK